MLLYQDFNNIKLKSGTIVYTLVLNYDAISVEKTYSNNGGWIGTWTLPMAYKYKVLVVGGSVYGGNNAFYLSYTPDTLTQLGIAGISIVSASRKLHTIYPFAIGY